MSAPKKQAPETAQEIARRELDEMVPEIMGGGSFYEDDHLRDLASFDEAIALATEMHGHATLDASDELGDGFTLLGKDDKGRLENVPLLLLEWAFRPGDFGSPFVSVRVAARNQDGTVGKYIINDGSTGIAEQLARFTKKTGKRGNLLVKGGLRRSEYDKELPDGKGGTYMTHATTWYLNV